jgi:hypothetical protein
VTRSLLAVIALTGTIALAGDWLNAGGDPQHSGWQRHGKRVTAETAHELKLLWKKKPAADAPLTMPIILSPTVTHRGVRELVFVAAADTVYAIDADFGSVFWTRHFEGSADRSKCANGRMATPVIEPDPDEDYFDGGVTDEEDNDDEPANMRPLYVLSTDGRLHTMRPTDGADISPPVEFLNGDNHASDLNIAGHSIYTTVMGGCGAVRDGVWSIDLKSGKKTLLEGAPLVPQVIFQWLDRGVILDSGKSGLLLRAAGKQSVLATQPGVFTGRAATWPDLSGTRWIYAPTSRGIEAFRVKGTAAQPRLERVWTSREMSNPGPPAVSHGVVYTLAGTTLYVLDSVTGRELWSSGDAVASAAREIAVANGHIIFTAADNTVYCFGVPIER